MYHAQHMEAPVRWQQVHVEEVLEAHLIVHLLVILIFVRLPYSKENGTCMYACMYV